MRRIRNLALGGVMVLTMWAVVGGTHTYASRSAAPIKFRILAKEVNSYYLFSPKKATIHKGTTVTWLNKSDVLHTVTSDTKSWKFNKNLPAGKTVSFKFTKLGTFKYHCKFHVSMGMKGTVIVKN